MNIPIMEQDKGDMSIRTIPIESIEEEEDLSVREMQMESIEEVNLSIPSKFITFLSIIAARILIQQLNFYGCYIR